VLRYSCHVGSRRGPDVDYERLLTFRTALRRFLRWSEQEALAAGLTAAQYQLLVVIKGLGDHPGPTVGEIAEELLLRHHSAGELVHRAEAAGLVVGRADPDDHRVVRVSLTPGGEAALRRLAPRHVEEIARLAPLVGRLDHR
jgi:DNA-binding MarR family transcriptional regulator